MTKERILEIINKSPKFPNPPNSLLELTQISFSREKSGSRGIYPLVSDYDNELLKICESKFYNIPQKISSLKKLIPVVGSKTLRNVIFLLWLFKLDCAGKYDSQDYQQLKLSWLLTASVAQCLSKHFQIGQQTDVFLQALLQNISLVALARSIPELYYKINNLDEKKANLDELEEKKIGISHAVLSSELLRTWDFPKSFTQPVKLHHQIPPHNNASETDKSIAKIIYFSELLSKTILLKSSSISFHQLELMFNRFFNRPAEELIKLVRTTLPDIKELAQSLRLHDSDKLSLIRLIRDKKEFLKREIIPYETLVEELSIAGKQIELLENKLNEFHESYSEHILYDALTGLYNHSYFQQMLTDSMSIATRYEFPLSVVLLDIDHFHLFNQTYGFMPGNSILQQMSELLKIALRKADIIARYSDDQFAIILSHTGKIQAQFVAEKIRKKIAEFQFEHPQKDMRHQLTVSVGYGSYDPRFMMIAENELMERISHALRKAHTEGGNCARSI